MRRFARYLIVLLLVGYGLLSVYAAAAPFWQTQGTLGFTSDYSARIRTVAENSPASAAGLAPGDLIHLDSLSFGERRYVAGVAAVIPVGTEIDFVFERNAILMHADLIAVKQVFSRADRLSLLFECGASLIFIFVGASLILLRPSPATWGFGLYCLIVLPTAPYPFMLTSAHADFALLASYDVLENVGVIGLILFALEFPRPLPSRWRTVVRRSLPLIFVVLSLMTLYPDVATLVLGWPAEGENDWLQLVFGLSLALPMVILIDTYRRIESQQHERLRWVLIGFGIGLFASFLGSTLTYSSLIPVREPPEWVEDTLDALNVLLPLAVAHAVIRHRVLDIDFVVSRALIYTGLTAGLVLVFGFLDWLFSHVLADFRLSLIVDAGISLALAFAFDELHKRAEEFIETVFFRKRRAAERRLNRLAGSLRQARTERVVEEALVSEAVDALELMSAALFQLNTNGRFERAASYGWGDEDAWAIDDRDVLVLTLREEKRPVNLADLPWRHADVPTNLQAPLFALPIQARNDLIGIAFYGGHRDGSDIDSGELAQLDRLVHAAAGAFDEIEAEQLRTEVLTTRETVGELEARLDELRRQRSPIP